MKLRTRLEVFSTALLSALGASSLVACGGSAQVEGGGASGSAGAGSAGASSGGVGGTVSSAGNACIRDSDCGENRVCLCGDPVGYCVKSECTSDADCAPGFLCRSHDASGGCGDITTTCQSAADTCGSDTDCAAIEPHLLCQFDPTAHHFKCAPITCNIGRPFLIEGEARRAPSATRDDWANLPVLPRLEAASATLSRHLAEQWTRVALLEHASIAAFARFSLQLLSLGAPSDLIERTTAAMADETRHANACFAVASHYAARPVGPGRLAIERSLDESSLREIVLNTIREGCVGETIAAIEAREAAEHVTDPALSVLLLMISDDETRHAELAFRFVDWALSLAPDELNCAARDEFATLARESASPPLPLTTLEEQALHHGVVPEAMRRVIRSRAIREVIVPCSRTLGAARARPKNLPIDEYAGG